jgi:hypothetical protein
MTGGVEIRRPRAHAIWASPLPGEDTAPERRIIHTVHAGFPDGGRPRVGLRAGRGYRKCGSRDEIDWVRDVRIHLWDGSDWTVGQELRDLPQAGGVGEVTWIGSDLPECRGVIVEVRRSWIDGWWPSWNLASRGVVVEGPAPDAAPLRGPATPLASEVDLTGLPTGVDAQMAGGEIRYRSKVLEVGFRLGRPALSFLAFDPDGLPDAPRDLLRHPTVYEGDGGDWIPNEPLFGQFALGPQLVTPDALSHLGQFAAVRDGRCTVHGNVVAYDLEVPALRQSFNLRWTVAVDGLHLEATRRGSATVRAVEASAWHLAFDCRVSPPCLLGRPERIGEIGRTQPPATLHVPGRGSLLISGSDGIGLRFEAARPLMTTAIEVRLGERVGVLGDVELPAGVASGTLSFRVGHGSVPALADHTPDAVQAGVRRAWLTGMTYRLDTTALSNNGASIHVPASLETWAPLAAAIGHINASTAALDLVRDTIDRYLDGAPGYGAGRTSFHGGLVQDEYIVTDPSVLLGLAHLLEAAPDDHWLAARAAMIRKVVERTRALDVDADGLIESSIRLGVTAGGDWSSNMCDNVSFGWKDAYANAILFDALTRLERVLPPIGWADIRDMAHAWRERCAHSYGAAFWNDATGWLAGWRSRDGVLHDPGFLWVNGAAVNAGLLSPERARSAIERLWSELVRLGFADFRLGLPLNVHSIARGDMIERYEGMPWGHVMPHGFNTNGAASLAGARHFLMALRRVGMDREADLALEGMMAGIAAGTAFGGCSSGIDLRTWDGTPCGYEGILTDQFGVMVAALEQYGNHAIVGPPG